MAADFWAGYASGAIGILIGNPLDLVKTRLQAGSKSLATGAESLTTRSVPVAATKHFENLTSLARGAPAPILGYGALNALLFLTYNRSLALLNTGQLNEWPERPSAWSVWAAGALGGLAIFFVSAPTELVKCRAQVSNPPRSSLEITKELWKQSGVRGLYLGGGVTSLRDSIGYGFYFWSYHISKQAMMRDDDSANQQALKILFCGGLAGIVTWASIFPLDVIKTRVQTWDLTPRNRVTQPLLGDAHRSNGKSVSASGPHTWVIARDAYRTEGGGVFFRGLGICSARAFIVNAVQWAVYEWMMRYLQP